MPLKMHEILAADSCSNIITDLKNLLFCNNVLVFADKIHQKYSFIFQEVAEHGTYTVELLSDYTPDSCK